MHILQQAKCLKNGTLERGLILNTAKQPHDRPQYRIRSYSLRYFSFRSTIHMGPMRPSNAERRRGRDDCRDRLSEHIGKK